MRILVIKLSAIGDFVQATGAMASIRQHHPKDQITLLTTNRVAGLGHMAPWFDEVVLDPRQWFWNLGYIWWLRSFLRQFDLIYDLQTSNRTKAYYKLYGKRSWCGHVKGADFAQTRADRNDLHNLDRFADQLARADIAPLLPPSVEFCRDDARSILTQNNLKPGKYILLIPGSSAAGSEKRWPHFSNLITHFTDQKQQIVVVGGPDEVGEVNELCASTKAINLAGKLSLAQLTDVLAKAKLCIGNDTGPSHIAGLTGTPLIVLFGNARTKQLCAQRGEHVRPLCQEPIAALTPQLVIETAEKVLNS